MSNEATYRDNLHTALLAATFEESLAGRQWYPTARQQMRDVARATGYEVRRVAFATAALSANMRWEPNVALVEQVAWQHAHDKKLTGHFPAVLRKAAAILDGNLDALSGPKVVPFAHALLGDTTAAVIDRWMYRAAGEPGYPTVYRTRQIACALREVAHELHLPVTEVQATIWLVVQRQAKEAGNAPE